MFLQMMKKGILLLGVLLVTLSCSEYQKVLKNDDTGKKYTMAEQLYSEAQQENSNKKYKKALRLFEQIVPEFRGKPQGQKLSYLFADTYYQLGDYYLSSYQFERFVQSYPTSEKAEEASFKKARSYYELSPRYFLDQSDTEKAIVELQNYLNAYPDGQYVAEANKMASELQVKLEKKAFEIAKQYHHTEDYKAAIVSFNNFVSDNPGSPFREAALYYKFDSAYKLAINSYRSLMEERLKEAQEYSQNYMKYYPNGEYVEQLKASDEDIKSRLQNF